MSNTVKIALTLLASVTAGLAASPPVALPHWAQLVLAAASAGLAGIGIHPLSYGTGVSRPE